LPIVAREIQYLRLGQFVVAIGTATCGAPLRAQPTTLRNESGTSACKAASDPTSASDASALAVRTPANEASATANRTLTHRLAALDRIVRRFTARAADPRSAQR